MCKTLEKISDSGHSELTVQAEKFDITYFVPNISFMPSQSFWAKCSSIHISIRISVSLFSIFSSYTIHIVTLMYLFDFSVSNTQLITRTASFADYYTFSL